MAWFRVGLLLPFIVGCRFDFGERVDAAVTPNDSIPTDAVTTPIAFVQRVQANCGAVTTCMVSVATKTGPHDALLATLTYDNTATSGSVADDFGDVYTRLIGPATWPQSPYRTEIWYTTAPATPQRVTATVTFTPPATSFSGIILNEYSGTSATTPVDQTAFAEGTTGTSTSSGFRMTVRDREMIVGHGEGMGPAVLLGAGFTVRDMTNGNIDEDKVVTTIGSYDAHFKLNFPGEWIACMVTLQ